MVKEERFNHILSQLKQNGKVSYEVLATDLMVSADTIRRDIDMLYGNGLLSKVRGGAILPAKNPLNFQDRTQYLSEGKETIALKALQFIKNGQTLFMDGGTTMCTIANHLPLHTSCRVVTNNQALIPILSKIKAIEIIVLGGTYHRDTATNTGVKTCQELGSYVADLYFMGTCALHSKFGITAGVKEDGEVKRAMLNASKQTIALCNTEKLNSTYNFKVCDINDVDALITEVPSDDQELNAYRNLGIQLL